MARRVMSRLDRTRHISASEMTCIVSSGALNSTHSLTRHIDVSTLKHVETNVSNHAVWQARHSQNVHGLDMSRQAKWNLGWFYWIIRQRTNGYWSLVRRVTSPKGHWSDGCCRRRRYHIEKGGWELHA